MDPVYEEVGEEDEKGELDVVVPRPEEICQEVVEAGVGYAVVEEAMAADFGDEGGDCEDCHDRNCANSLLDLHAHLVLEVFGVLEGGLVEDEDIAECCAAEIDYQSENPIDKVSVPLFIPQGGFPRIRTM